MAMFVTIDEYEFCVDQLNKLAERKDFPVINKMDIRYRAYIGHHIVSKYLPAEDLRAAEELGANRREWNVFRAPHLYDGNRETVITLQMGLLYYMGARPFGFLEGDGSVARRVLPVEGRENHASTAGRIPFDAHIDHAALRFPWEPEDGRGIIPDFLSLGGYWNPNKIGTCFADRRDILAEASETSRYVLEKPEFSMPTPPSVKPARIATYIPIVVRGPDHLPVMRINPRIIPETPRAADALAELKVVMANDRLWTEVILEPGDVVVARGTALHKRGEVIGDRELTAVYGRHHSTKSRVLSEANPHLEPVYF